ncbi:MAG TPA: COQ9 family protein [Stellaceae bacterium]|nr:COQ9 family protein [Stellaceae bacterium]
MDEQEQKDALLAALLPDIPFDGWTIEGMRAAATRVGMKDADVSRLFPRGPREAVRWFSHWADRLMLETVAAQPIEGMKLSERVALAVRTRLQLLTPHREAVRRGLSLLAMPPNAALGLKLLYDTVDAIWYAAGDTSTDFSFYTKRAMLAGIYGATMLFWLDDRSENAVATDAFLDRRLAETMVLPRLRSRIGRITGGFPDPTRFFRLVRPRL